MFKIKYICRRGSLYFVNKLSTANIWLIVKCQALKQELALLLELHLTSSVRPFIINYSFIIKTTKKEMSDVLII